MGDVYGDMIAEEEGKQSILKQALGKAKGTRFVALNQVLAAITQIQKVKGHFQDFKDGVISIVEDPISAVELLTQIGNRPEVLNEILGTVVGDIKENFIGPITDQVYEIGDTVIELAQFWKPTNSLKGKDYRALKKYFTKKKTMSDLTTNQKKY